MATRYNYTGGIVTNGLVLNLDAAKTDSYPGTGTTWRDLSGNNNNGTLTNGPTFSGIGKQASIVFDGVDDYAVIPNTSSSLALSNSDFSIFNWVNVSSFNQFSSFIGKADATATRKEWSLQVSRQATFRPAFLATDNTSSWAVELNSPNTLSFNQWYQVGVNRVGGRFDLYINGSPVANTTNNITILTNNLNAEIGRLVNDSTYDFTGRISNITIYKDKVTSQFDIFQNFNSLKGRYGIPDIVTDGLVLNLDAGNPYSYLQESSGTTWTDVSGNDNNGTLINGTAYSNGTMVFDGVDDYISTGVFDMGTPTDITLECFIRFNGSLDSNDRKVMHYDKTGTTAAVFQLRKGDNAGRIKYQHHDGSTWHTLDLDNAIESDTWVHIVVTQIANNAIMYKNGVSSASSGMGYLDWTNANNLLIGYRYAAEYWKGDVALMKIYNRALSADEVSQNFNALRGRYGI